MAQPYKTCPQCGQPAVLEMPQCRRCGFFYTPSMSPQAAGGYPMPPGYPGAPAYPPASPVPIPERKRGSQGVVSGCVVVAVILLFLVVSAALLRPHSRMRRRRVGSMIMTTQPAQPNHGSDLTNQVGQSSPAQDLTNQAGQSTGNQGGMFQETESVQEMPTIQVINDESDHMTLVLTDAQGHDYKAISTRGAPQILKVPPGDYRVQLYSDDPLIQANQGDAIFRKYKNYTAKFYLGPARFSEPIHLGD